MNFPDNQSMLWYLGGFFDADGCITINRRGKTVVIQMSQVDRSILELFRAVFGGVIRHSRPYRQHGQRSSWNCWYLNSKVGRMRFLHEITPYLHQKKCQAMIVTALEHLSRGDQRKDELIEAFFDLRARVRETSHIEP